MEYNKWSDYEIELLKKYYIDGGYELCKDKGLKRSKSGIIGKAKSLGLKKKTRKRGWSKEEIIILSKYYIEGGTKLCIEKGLNRSEKVIIHKANSMGLRRDNTVKWEDSEIELLQKYYIEGGVELCIKRGLNRSKGAIHSKAYSLGIECVNIDNLTKKNQWSEEECKIVAMYYPVGGAKLCQEQGLNRSDIAIRGRAQKMGLVMNLDVREGYWVEKECNILKEYYPVGGAKLCQEKGVDRTLKAIKKKATELGLDCSEYSAKVLNLWSDSEVDILKEYYPVGGAKLCQKKGLNRTEIAIKRKAKIYFDKYLWSYIDSVNTHPYKWSDLELNILKKYYPVGGSTLCIEKGLNRSRDAIRSKAIERGIKVLNLSEVMKLKECAWSEEEDAIMVAYYPKGGSVLVQQKGLNRSVEGIQNRARVLGLNVLDVQTLIASKRVTTWTDIELSILKAYYYKGAKYCQDKGLNRDIDSIRRKAYKLGLKVVKGS